MNMKYLLSISIDSALERCAAGKGSCVKEKREKWIRACPGVEQWHKGRYLVGGVCSCCGWVHGMLV